MTDDPSLRRGGRLPIVTVARHALRRWLGRSAFVLTVVLTLALGIGGVTAIASVVDAVLLRPLPWEGSNRLVTISLVNPDWRQIAVLAPMWDRGPLFGTQFHHLVTHSRTLASVAAWRPGRPILTAMTREAVPALYISSSFLRVLGVSPYAGRNFGPQDESATDAVLVSYGTWQRRYGGSSAAVGSRVTIDDSSRTIVGILPPHFAFDLDHDSPEFYLPLGNSTPSDGASDAYYGLARLAPGVSVAQAFVDIEPIIRGALPCRSAR